MEAPPWTPGRSTSGLSVSPQITPPMTCKPIADQGFRAIICNRPDGEGNGPAELRGNRGRPPRPSASRPTCRSPPARSATRMPRPSAPLTELPGPCSPIAAPARARPRSGRWPGARTKPLPTSSPPRKAAGYDMGGVVRRIANGGKTPTDRADAQLRHRDRRRRCGRDRRRLLLKSRASRGPRDRHHRPADIHYYQPGWTMVGGGIFEPDTAKTMGSLIPKACTGSSPPSPPSNPRTRGHPRWLPRGEVQAPDRRPGPEARLGPVEGLVDTLGRNGVTSNYRYDLAPYTWELVKGLKQGRAIFTQPPMPIKCAGAPQKALYLSGDHWYRTGVLKEHRHPVHECRRRAVRRQGLRARASGLHEPLQRAELNFFHNLTAIDGPAKKAWFEVKEPEQGGETVEVEFDMIHVVPAADAPDFIRVSPLADAAGWVDVDQARCATRPTRTSGRSAT
jgi:sulfide:quinone oxidoreductase